MGILELLGVGKRNFAVASGSVRLGVASPYSTAADFGGVIVSDLFGDDALKNWPMDRTQAIAIPAVSKNRNLLVATISKFPLKAIRAEGTDVTTNFPWLYRTDNAVTPLERMAWTIDDLIFYGCSLWLVERGAADGDGRKPILNAEWCPPQLWTITDGKVLVDEQELDDDAWILINSPFEGLLTVGARTLRGARDVEDAWVGRARNPIPLINLKRNGTEELDEAGVKALVDAYAAARTNPNGAIGSTPQGIDIEVFGDIEPALMVEGRNAIRTDVGSFLNTRVAMLDGTIGVDSLTYSTKDGERNAFYEFDLPFWTDPIAARLSLDDVVPRGTRIRFDMYEALNLPTPTGPKVED
jgi:hypothetical protein